MYLLIITKKTVENDILVSKIFCSIQEAALYIQPLFDVVTMESIKVIRIDFNSNELIDEDIWVDMDDVDDVLEASCDPIR